MNLKKWISLLLTAVLLLTLFSGCGKEKDAYVPTGNALVMEDDSTVATVEKEDEKIQDLTLVYYPDKSMNPLTSTDFTNRTLFSLLYQGLFSVNRSYQVEPVLCSKYSMSSDMMIYTFYLERATFSDGSPVTEADVVATLLAAKESNYYEGRFQHVRKVEAGENGGIVVTLDTPYENLPILLDVPILKAEQLEDPRPLGTGPYVFEQGTGGARLRRRLNWWCKAELATNAEGILLIRAESPAQIRDEFEFGQVGLVCTNPASDTYADYRSDFELWDCETGMMLYLGCNMDSPVFSNNTVRAALTHAIDRNTITEKFYRGYGRSATLPASPQSPYYSHSLAEDYTYDGLKFVDAVNAAGMKGKEVILMVNKDDSLRLRVAREIAQMLTDSGLIVQLKEVGSHEYHESLIYRTYDLYLGQTRLSANMDLTPFLYVWGEISYGHMEDSNLYALCLDALANSGNYLNLHQKVMNDGRLCPILFCGYAVYATRGLLSDLVPARDNVFWYSTGKTMDDALME